VEKFGVQSQPTKLASSLEFFLFCHLSLHTLSLPAIQATTVITVRFSATISTTRSQHNHRPATATAGPLPLQIFLFFILPAATTLSQHRLHHAVLRHRQNHRRSAFLTPSSSSSSSSSSLSQCVNSRFTPTIHAAVGIGPDLLLCVGSGPVQSQKFSKKYF